MIGWLPRWLQPTFFTAVQVYPATYVADVMPWAEWEHSLQNIQITDNVVLSGFAPLALWTRLGYHLANMSASCTLVDLYNGSHTFMMDLDETVDESAHLLTSAVSFDPRHRDTGVIYVCTDAASYVPVDVPAPYIKSELCVGQNRLVVTPANFAVLVAQIREEFARMERYSIQTLVVATSSNDAVAFLMGLLIRRFAFPHCRLLHFNGSTYETAFSF